MKIVPIKSGVHRVVEGKRATRYELKAGVEIEIPKEIVGKLKKKGFIEQYTAKKTIKKEDK